MLQKEKKKTFGFWMLTALVVGNMVGSGVFLLPASLAKLGSLTLISWVLTAIGAVLLSLVFAKLSTVFPKTGGPYIYCREGFGDFIGFQVAYNYWIYMWVGNAAIAVAMTGYLTIFFPILAANKLVSFLVTAGVVWLFTLVNIWGLKFAGIVQLITTILKLIPLFLVGLVGLFYMDIGNLREFNISSESTPFAISTGAAMTLWAFLGLESGTVPADSVINPKKTIPRATIFGTSLAAVIYILVTVAIFGVIPPSVLQHSNAPFADMAEIMFGPFGRAFIAVGAIIACLGALNGWIMLQAQVPLAAAKDDLFPRKFKQLSKRGTPTFGLVLSSILVTLLLLLNFNKSLVSQFTFIIMLATLAAIVAYLYTAMAEFIVFTKKRGFFRKKDIAKPLIISSLAFVYAFWAVMASGEQIVFLGSLLMFSSIPIYAWLIWSHPKHLIKNS